MKKLITIILILFTAASFAQTKGKIVRLKNFESRFIPSRNVDVWLPENYNPKKRYNVIYMHNGQMLFDSTKTWNGQEWRVDETVNSLMLKKWIKNTIVVGVWNIPERQYAEYFPQKVAEKIAQPVKKEIFQKQFKTEPAADNYLMFLVYELKPYIDTHFSTFTRAQHTFIMGSSMGGLISLYAICEYPTIFGGAAALSTHSPMVSYELFDKIDVDKEVASLFRTYLMENLPKAARHKIYMDYGTETLDSIYKPFQDKIDTVFHKRGYNKELFKSLCFPGTDHSEKSWAKRLHEPILFLLKNSKLTPL